MKENRAQFRNYDFYPNMKENTNVKQSRCKAAKFLDLLRLSRGKHDNVQMEALLVTIMHR
jgi:hypothetical protein